MANASITAWLNHKEKDYQTGVILYAQIGSSKLLKAFFNKGKSAYHLSRLIETLGKLNTELAETIQPVVMIIPAVSEMPFSPRIYSLTDAEWDAAPGVIKDLYTENSKLKSHAELLHHQIRVSGTSHDRLSMALELLDDRDKRNDNWTIIKDFQETGKVKDRVIQEAGKSIEQLTMPELNAILKNFPTYLSKDKARLEGLPDGVKKNKVLLRIQEREAILQLAKARLENVQLV